MSRDAILTGIRRRLGAERGDLSRMARVRDHVDRHSRNTVPVRATGKGEELIQRFEEMLARVKGTTGRVGSLDEVPTAIAAYLGSDSRTVCLSPEVARWQLPWQGLSTTPWLPRQSFDVCVTACVGGAAETGTVAVASGRDSALTQNILGDTHVVIMFEDQLEAGYESLLDRVRGELPRHVTFVSGPSCTGDIEMILEYGAHGPKQVHVVIVATRT